jgi:cell division protein FtsL
MSASLLSLTERRARRINDPVIDEVTHQPIRRTVRRSVHRPLHHPDQDGGTTRVRPFVKRWITAVMLLVCSVLAVLYVSNAIAVNDLLGEIISLERERDVVQSENEQLRAELLRLMSVKRITNLATDKLGMVQPDRPPIALEAVTEMPAGQ